MAKQSTQKLPFMLWRGTVVHFKNDFENTHHIKKLNQLIALRVVVLVTLVIIKMSELQNGKTSKRRLRLTLLNRYPLF